MEIFKASSDLSASELAKLPSVLLGGASPSQDRRPSISNESSDDAASIEKFSDDGGTSGASTTGSLNAENAEGGESYNTPDYVPGCFEGPEKNMEVVFRADKGASDGLRSLSRAQLDTLCTKAKCTILSKISNSYLDAYVLSESSLFVYKHRYIMKTCGTTTLLRCLSTLLEYADELGMELDWVGYSRKNLQFPSAQLWPHSNFGDEIKYIQTHDKLQDRLRGSGYILGPITDDHWFVYVADHSQGLPSNPSSCFTPPAPPTSPMMHSSASSSSLIGEPSTERTINLMMFDMSVDVAQTFYQKNCATGKEMTAKSGISNLCPGATIDETAFSPCGYSMNALLHDAYFTVHITPEPQCSYASFETNTNLRNYSSMVRNVLNVFKPKRFVLTMFGDEAGINGIQELPMDPRQIIVPGFGTYTRTSLASTKVETELCCFMGCYSLDASSPVKLNDSSRATSTGLLRDRGYSLC